MRNVGIIIAGSAPMGINVTGREHIRLSAEDCLAFLSGGEPSITYNTIWAQKEDEQ